MQEGQNVQMQNIELKEGVSILQRKESIRIKHTGSFLETGIDRSLIVSNIMPFLHTKQPWNNTKPTKFKQFSYSSLESKDKKVNCKPNFFSFAHQDDTDQPSTGKLVFGGVAGGVLGTLPGAAIITGTALSSVTGYNKLGIALMGLAVAVTGETIGIASGVHFANKKQGNAAITFLGSAAGIAAGIGLAMATDNVYPFLASPLLQIPFAVWIERKTTQN